MVTDGGSTSSGGHTGVIGLTVFFFFFLLLITLFTKDVVSEGLKSEFAMMDNYLPSQTMSKISQRTTDWYQTIIVDSGFQKGTYRLFLPDREEMRLAQKMGELGSREFPWFEEKLNNFFNLIYQFMLRLSHILAWYPLLAIVILPCAVDGWARRKIKKTNFDYTSPVFSYYSAKLCVWILIGIWIALWLPLAYPPIFVPIFCLLFCLLVNIFVSNIQKRI